MESAVSARARRLLVFLCHRTKSFVLSNGLVVAMKVGRFTATARRRLRSIALPGCAEPEERSLAQAPRHPHCGLRRDRSRDGSKRPGNTCGCPCAGNFPWHKSELAPPVRSAATLLMPTVPSPARDATLDPGFLVPHKTELIAVLFIICLSRGVCRLPNLYPHRNAAAAETLAHRKRLPNITGN